MKQHCVDAVVCFIRRNKKVLLQERAQHQRWAGTLNGPGGKIESGESPLEAIKREVAEETALQIHDVTSHGTLRLVFSSAAEPDLFVHVFSTSTFNGRSRGTAGRLQWFQDDGLPFDRMCPDQRYWLPLVLAGGRLDGICRFNGGGPQLCSCELQLTLATAPELLGHDSIKGG